MNKTKTTLKTWFITKNKKLSKILLHLGMAIFVVSSLLIPSQVSGEAQTRFVPLETGGFGSNQRYFGLAVVDEDGIFEGLVDCRKDLDTGFFSSTRNNRSINSTQCIGFFVERTSPGDPFPSNAKLLSTNAEPVTTSNTDVPSLHEFSNQFYIQGGTGIYIHETLNEIRNRASTPECTGSNAPNVNRITSGQCTGINSSIAAFANNTTTQSTVAGNLTADDEAQAAKASSEQNADLLEKNGSVCKGLIDDNNTQYYTCSRAGTQVGPEDTDLPEGCFANSQGKSYFSISDSGGVSCADQSKVEELEAKPINDNSVVAETTTLNATEAEQNSGAGDKIVEVLLNLVAGIVGIILYLIGGIVQFIYFAVANMFLYIVRINPAAANFIEVATEPWNIITQLANIIILGSFIFVGLGYIVGLDQVTKKKNSASDFLINIVIIGVTINFTLVASATVVNVIQGVGDLMLASYSQSGENDGRVSNKVIINNVIEGVQKTSTLRCGNLDPGQGCERADSEENELAVAWERLTGGNIASIAIREALYIAILLYAIFIFLKLLRLALFRAVGLWLLMIVSPVALVLYLSPLDKMKKYATQWFDLFWQMSVFYPAFVLALTIVNSLSGAFDSSVREIANTAANPNVIGGVVANAQAPDEQELLLILFAVLSAVVSVFTLQIVADFFEKGFGSIASAALNAVTAPVGQAFKGAGAVAAAGIGASNKLFNAADNSGLKKLQSTNNNRIKALQNEINAGTAAGTLTSDDKKRLKSQITGLRKENFAASEKVKQNAQRRQALKEGVRGGFRTIGDVVESTDDILKTAGDIPGGYFKNLGMQRQARQQRLKESFNGRAEAFLRSNPVANAAVKASGYDMDANPNLNRFNGMDPKAMEALKKNKGKGHIKKEIESRAKGIYDKTLGKKTDYDSDVASALLDSLSKEINEVGGVNNLSAGKKEKYRSLMKQAITDDNLRQKVMNDDNLVGFAQDQYSFFNDPKVEDVIANKAPLLHGDQDQRDRFAADAARSKKYRDKIDPDNFRDAKFAEVAERYGMSAKDIREKTLNEQGLSSTINEQVKRANYDGTEKVGDRDVNVYKDLNADETRNIDNAVDSIVNEGLAFEDELISDLARIDSDPTFSDVEKNTLKADALKKYEKRYFGNDNITDIDELNRAIDSGDFEKSELGQKLIKKGNIDTSTESGKKQLKQAAKNMQQTYLQTMYGVEQSNFDKNGKLDNTNNVSFNTADSKYAKTLDAAVKSHSKLVAQKKGVTELSNNTKKLSDSLAENPQDLAARLNDADVQSVLGAEKVGLDLADKLSKRDNITLKDSATGNDVNYSFESMTPDQRSEFAGDMNRYLAASTGKDQAATDRIRTEMQGKYGSNTEADAFMNAELFNDQTNLRSQISSEGQKIAIKKIDQTKKKNGDPLDPSVASDRKKLESVAQSIGDDSKKTRSKQMEKINEQGKKVVAGDWNMTVDGTDENNIDTGRVTSGGPGGGTVVYGPTGSGGAPFNTPSNGGGSTGDAASTGSGTQNNQSQPRISNQRTTIGGRQSSNSSSSQGNSTSQPTPTQSSGNQSQSNSNLNRSSGKQGNIARNRNLDQTMTVPTIGGDTTSATREEVIRDHKSDSPKFNLSQDVIDAERLDDYDINSENKVTFKGEATPAEYTAGNQAFNSAPTTPENLLADLERDNGPDFGNAATTAQDERLRNFISSNVPQSQAPRTASTPAPRPTVTTTPNPIPVAASTSTGSSSAKSTPKVSRSNTADQNIAAYKQSTANNPKAPKFEDLAPKVQENIKSGGAVSEGKAKKNVDTIQNTRTEAVENKAKSQEKLDRLNIEVANQGAPASNRQQAQINQAQREIRESDKAINQAQSDFDAAVTEYNQVKQERADRQASGINSANTSNFNKVSPDQTRDQNIKAYNNSKAVQSGKAKKFDQLDANVQNNIAGGGAVSVGKVQAVNQTAQAKVQDSNQEIQNFQQNIAAMEQDAANAPVANGERQYKQQAVETAKANLETAQAKNQELKAQAAATQQQADQAVVQRGLNQAGNKAANTQSSLDTKKTKMRETRATGTSEQYEAAKSEVKAEFAKTNTAKQKEIPVEKRDIKQAAIPNANNLRVSKDEAEQNVQQYYDKAAQNYNVTPYNDLSPEQRSDIANGRRQSEKVMEDDIKQQEATVEAYRKATDEVNKEIKATQKKIEKGNKSNDSMIFTGIADRNRNKQYKQAQQNINKAVDTAQTQVGNNIGVDKNLDAKIQQNIQTVAKETKNVQSDLNVAVEDKRNMANSAYGTTANQSIDRINKAQAQNESLINEASDQVENRRNQLNERKAQRAARNNTSNQTTTNVTGSLNTATPPAPSQTPPDPKAPKQGGGSSSASSDQGGSQDDDNQNPPTGGVTTPNNPRPNNSGGGAANAIPTQNNQKITKEEQLSAPQSARPDTSNKFEFQPLNQGGQRNQGSTQKEVVNKSNQNTKQEQVDQKTSTAATQQKATSPVPQISGEDKFNFAPLNSNNKSQPTPATKQNNQSTTYGTNDNTQFVSNTAQQRNNTQTSTNNTNTPKPVNNQKTEATKVEPIKNVNPSNQSSSRRSAEQTKVNTQNNSSSSLNREPTIQSATEISQSSGDNNENQNKPLAPAPSPAMPIQSDKFSFIENIKTDTKETPAAVETNTTVPTPQLTTSQSTSTPQAPAAFQAETKSYSATENFANATGIPELADRTSDFRNVQEIKQKGFTETQARNIDFAQDFMKNQNPNKAKVLQRTQQNLTKIDPTGQATAQFDKLLKKSQTEPKGLTEQELLTLSNLLTQ